MRSFYLGGGENPCEVGLDGGGKMLAEVAKGEGLMKRRCREIEAREKVSGRVAQLMVCAPRRQIRLTLVLQ